MTKVRLLVALNLILFPILLSYLDYSALSICAILLSLIICLALPQKNIAIGLLNIFSGALGITPMYSILLKKLDAAQSGIGVESIKPNIIFGLLYIFSIFLYGLISWKAILFNRKQVLFWVVAANFLISLLCFTGNIYLEVSGLLFISGLWFNLFYIFSLHERRFAWSDFLASQNPFFSFWIIPIPPVLSSKIGMVSQNLSERIDVQVSAFYLQLALIAFRFIQLKLISLSKSVLPIKIIMRTFDVPWSGLAIYRGLPFGVAEKWFMTVGSYLYFVITLFVMAGPSVVACRILGVKLKSTVYQPYLAKTFYEFFERVNHYYSMIVVDLFVIPMAGLTRFVKNKSARYFFNFWIGIFVCGLVDHYFSLLYSRTEPSLKNMLYFYTGNLPYWMLVGLFSSASIVFERRLFNFRFYQVLRPLRLGIIVAVSSVIFIFVRDFNVSQIPLEARWQELWGLFWN